MANASDQELATYLGRCSNEVVFDLAYIVGDRLGFNGIRKRLSTPAEVPSGEGRHGLVDSLVAELGYFGRAR